MKRKEKLFIIYIKDKPYVMLEDADIAYRSDDLDPDRWYAMTVYDKQADKAYMAWYHVPEDINDEDYNEPDDYIDWEAPNEMDEIDPEEYWDDIEDKINEIKSGDVEFW